MASAQLAIRDEIGADGLTAKAFIGQLEALGAVDKITLNISSYGGSVKDGVAIANALRQHPAHKTGIVESIVASAATFALMACDEILAHDFSFLMVHNASSGCYGDWRDMTQQADALRKMDASIARNYSQRTGLPESAWAEAMASETWLSGPELAETGLAKLIDSGRPVNPMQSAKGRDAISNRSSRSSAIVAKLTARAKRPPARSTFTRYPGWQQDALDRIEIDTIALQVAESRRRYARQN